MSVKFSSSILTKTDVLRSLATGIQNIPIELKDGDVVYAVDTEQSGNTIIVECTDGSKVNITVDMQ